MIDRLVIGWSDVWQCGDQRSVAMLMGGLANGRNLRGDRLSRGYYWEPGPPLRLRLRCWGRADDFMTCTVSFDRYASPSGTLRVSGEIHINPTRLIAHLDGQSVEEWFRTCRVICPRSEVDRQDNFLPINPSAPARAEYYWCDLAAQIADNFISLAMAALYGDRTQRPLRMWLKQAEAYWEFGTLTPIRSVEDVIPAIRACAGASEARYERFDEMGVPVLSLSLDSGSSHRLKLYPRDARVRVEVTYLSRVARFAAGAGSGDIAGRLRCVVDASVRHVNRALNATRSFRQQGSLVGAGTIVELVHRAVCTLQCRSDRLGRIIDELRRNSYVRAGNGAGCSISLNEAHRLQRAGVLVRRSVRSRDPEGRVFALDSYFATVAADPRLNGPTL